MEYVKEGDYEPLTPDELHELDEKGWGHPNVQRLRTTLDRAEQVWYNDAMDRDAAAVEAFVHFLETLDSLGTLRLPPDTVEAWRDLFALTYERMTKDLRW